MDDNGPPKRSSPEKWSTMQDIIKAPFKFLNESFFLTLTHKNSTIVGGNVMELKETVSVLFCFTFGFSFYNLQAALDF